MDGEWGVDLDDGVSTRRPRTRTGDSVRWRLLRRGVSASSQVVPDLISKDQPCAIDLVARHDAPLQPAIGGQFGHSKNFGQLLDGEVLGVRRKQIIQPAHWISADGFHDTAA